MDEYIHRFSGQQIDDAVEAVLEGNVVGGGGGDGGYYTPSVTQVDENTARFSFTPSKNEMNEVADVDVDLPPGADGKSAYAYAQDGGYTGTEAEFGAKLAEEAPKVFYITVTENADGTYSKDKTIEEIVAAYEAGKSLFCFIPGGDGCQGVCTLTAYGEHSGYPMFVFAVTTNGQYTTDPILVGTVYIIGDFVSYVNYEVAKRSDIPTSLKNPNALTINGTSYDGSGAKDFTSIINAMIDAKLGVIENGAY